MRGRSEEEDFESAAINASIDGKRDSNESSAGSFDRVVSFLADGSFPCGLVGNASPKLSPKPLEGDNGVDCSRGACSGLAPKASSSRLSSKSVAVLRETDGGGEND